MCPELSAKTVLDGLLFADTNKITKLKQNCIEYFNTNSPEVLKQTDKWNQFVLNANAPLLAQLYYDLALKHHQSHKTIKHQRELIDNHRNDRPENYSPKLNRTKEYCRIGSWLFFGLACIVMICFMSYAIYVGINLSVSYTVLVVLFLTFIVFHYSVTFYQYCKSRLAQRRARHTIGQV